MKRFSLIAIPLILTGAIHSQEATPTPKHKIGVSYFVVPAYPPIARAARVQGSVKLTLQIASDGQVKDATGIVGPPILQVTALEAVEKWRFLCLDCAIGESFDHSVTVDFDLRDPENECQPATVISFPDRMVVYDCALLISDPPARLKKRSWWRRLLHI